jgi:hypothetical protein
VDAIAWQDISSTNSKTTQRSTISSSVHVHGSTCQKLLQWAISLCWSTWWRDSGAVSMTESSPRLLEADTWRRCSGCTTAHKQVWLQVKTLTCSRRTPCPITTWFWRVKLVTWGCFSGCREFSGVAWRSLFFKEQSFAGICTSSSGSSQCRWRHAG